MAALIDLSGASLPRKIASPGVTLDSYITVEEAPSDMSTITKHPVDSGAIMSDHIYLMPPEIRVVIAWSNADAASSGVSYTRDLYNKLLQLKNARQLCTLYAGKRLYNNMFPAEIRPRPMDYKNEFSMIVDVQFVQVLLVNLSTVSNSPTAVSAASAPNPTNNASPQTNQPTVSSGPTQPQQVDTDPSSVRGISPHIGSFNEPNTPAVTNNNNGGSGPPPFIPFL